MQRGEEILRALLGVDGEIGAGGVADEQRVAREHRRGAAALDHLDRAVLRPVAGGVDCAQDDAPELDLVAVAQRLVREGRAGGLVHAHRQSVLERQAPVPGDVVGVRVRLDHDHRPDARGRTGIQVALDRVSRIDDGRDAGTLVSDEVRAAPQVVVDELPEQHDPRRYHRLRLSISK